MADTESILSRFVLSLQICLAFWQVIKLTAFAAFIKALVSRCICFLPSSLVSSPYSRLKDLEQVCFIFKLGECLVTKEADDEGSVVARELISHDETSIHINYLGNDFHLERKESHKLFVNGKMSYYITDVIWRSLLGLKIVDSDTVFLKGHKDLGDDLYAGGVMDLSEVLDCLILRNHIIKPLLLVYAFIPINLSVSEEKILKGINIIGLFLQTKKHIHWLIPLMLSLTSAVLEFCTPLRRRIYSTVNAIFCWAMHPPCDRLPPWWRLFTYSFIFGWAEKMKPSNDVEWRVVRGVNSAVIGGGAKVSCLEINASSLIHHPTQLQEIPCNREEFSGSTQLQEIPCIREEFSGSQGEFPITARLSYDASGREATIILDCGSHVPYSVSIKDFEEGKYAHLRTFTECLLKNRSGSLESYEAKSRVCKVRGFKESIVCYVKNGYPEVYELRLENAVIK